MSMVPSGPTWHFQTQGLFFRGCSWGGTEETYERAAVIIITIIGVNIY